MSMIDDRTSALSLPLPHPQNDLGVDVLRLRTAIIGLDTASASQAAELAQVRSDAANLRDALQTVTNTVQAADQRASDQTEAIAAMSAAIVSIQRLLLENHYL